MRDNLYCLYADGGSLTDAARNFLYAAACVMVDQNLKTRTFKGGDGEVNLRTNFQISCLGMFAGTKFEAVLEFGDVTIRTAFIIRDRDFVRNIQMTETWVPGLPPHTKAMSN